MPCVATRRQGWSIKHKMRRSDKLSLFCFIVFLIIAIAFFIYLVTDLVLLSRASRAIQNDIRTEADVEAVVRQCVNPSSTTTLPATPPKPGGMLGVLGHAFKTFFPGFNR